MYVSFSSYLPCLRFTEVFGFCVFHWIWEDFDHYSFLIFLPLFVRPKLDICETAWYCLIVTTALLSSSLQSFFSLLFSVDNSCLYVFQFIGPFLLQCPSHPLPLKSIQLIFISAIILSSVRIFIWIFLIVPFLCWYLLLFIHYAHLFFYIYEHIHISCFVYYILVYYIHHLGHHMMYVLYLFLYRMGHIFAYVIFLLLCILVIFIIH